VFLKLIKKTHKKIEKHENARQLVTYFLIGSFNAISDLAILFLLVDFLKIFYLYSQTISFIFVATIAFFLHKNYTFRHKGRNNKLRYIIFLVIASSGLLWNLLLLSIFVEFFKIKYLLAATIIKFIIFLWNYTMNRLITFRVMHREEYLN
jgi:putative flippase GtrA